ncbi:TIGR03667 family PPOX class F420-dependent oxidoreductase [Antrihabitans spumae]|jgi:PPOX class probable F420-dependent enzyme|uniref:TIGR03667 family PPOX class F420-dependent oxidoreductase n=1 Tax=Antrihabitans spumae TaxID=3373370 RepID=A0ABW7JP47_9NOCA
MAVEVPENVTGRLNTETVIWLTTVGKTGTPAPTPVWFLWSGREFLVFSQPEVGKLANIGRGPAVALNFNSSAKGGAVSVFTGIARVDDAGPTDDEWQRYVAKYADDIVGLDYTPERFLADYSVLVRIEPDKLRGW